MFIKRLDGASGPLEKVEPLEVLREVAALIPDEYKSNRQYPFCLEMLDQGEWGLALEHLLYLAEETGYTFSPQGWHGLAVAADKMGMSDEAQFCRQQI